MAARSHTIEFYGEFEGKYKQELVNPGFDAPYWKTGDVWFDIFALGCRIEGFPNGWNNTLERVYNVTVTMPTGGTNGADTLTLTFTLPGFGLSDAQLIDFTGGGWSISCVVEEIIVNTGTGFFPTYGGSAVPDGEKESNQARYERLKPGSTLTATITAGGMSATGTFLVPADPIYYVSHALTLEFEGQAWGDDGAIATTGFYDWGGGVYTLSAPFSGSSNLGHLGAGNACVAYAPGSAALRTITNSVLNPPKKWAFYPRVRAMEQAYPEAITFSVDRNKLDLAAEVIVSGAGTLAESGTQNRYDASAGFWQATDSGSDTTGLAHPRNWTKVGVTQPTPALLDEWQPFRCYLRNQWLVASGEPVRDWRTQILETPFPAYSLQHAGSYTAEDGTNAWTNGANVTPSNSGGCVVLAVAGGVGSASRTFALTGRENTINPADDWESYRSLEIELQANGSSKPFTLSVEGKEWSGDTHASANTDSVVTFDLNAPHNAASPTDGTDSRWPLTTPSGDYFGLVKAAVMTLSGLEDGVTYKINRITLVRSTRARVTHALAFERWAANGVGSDYNRHVTGEVDGKVGLEVAGMTRTIGGFDYTYGYPPISDCVIAINQRPGWTATLAGSYPDSQHDSSLPLMYCGGKDGGYYDGGWHDSFDEDAAGSLSITAQPQFDSIDWYPACGDIQTLTYGEVTPMRVYKALRAEAWGVVIDNTTHAGDAGESVDITGGTSPDETQTTDSLGHYRSNPRKEATVNVAVGGSSLSRLLHNRYRVFGGFGAIGGTVSDSLSTDFSRGGRKVRVYRVDGTIRIAIPDDADWTNYIERDTGIAGRPTEARWEKSGRQNLLFLSYIDNEDVLWLLSSANEGLTWIMAVTLASGCTQNGMAVGRNNLTYNYYRTAAGALKGIIVNSLGTIVVEEFEVLASGVDDKDVTCAVVPGYKGAFLVVIDYYDGGDLTQIRSVDGVVFS